MAHVIEGDWTRARSASERAIEVHRTGNVTVLQSGPVAASAWVLAELGAASQALTRLQEGTQLVERQAARGLGNLGWTWYCLGRACIALGRPDEARHLAERAIDTSRSLLGYAAYARHRLGDLAAHPEGFDAGRAGAHYREALALALAEPRDMRPLVAHCHLGLAKLYGRTGQPGQAQEHLTTATTMYRDMGMTHWLEKGEAELRDLATSPRRSH